MSSKRKLSTNRPRWDPDDQAAEFAEGLCAGYGADACSLVEGLNRLRSMLAEKYSLWYYSGTSAPTNELEGVFQLTKVNMELLYNQADFLGGWNDKAKYREIKSRKTHIMLLHDRGAGLVGFISYRFIIIDEFQPPTEVCYIYELQVNSSCRSRGIGSFLMYAVELVAKHVRAKKLMCTVLKLNKRAVSFYRDKCGFVDDESDPDVVDFDNRHDHVYHILKLELTPT